jgi:hypothetical protein
LWPRSPRPVSPVPAALIPIPLPRAERRKIIELGVIRGGDRGHTAVTEFCADPAPA